MERDGTGTLLLQIIWEPEEASHLPEACDGRADQVLDRIALTSQSVATYSFHWDSRTRQGPISRIQLGNSASVLLASPKWRS